MSYVFPFSVVEKDKEGYYRDRHIQNIDVIADSRQEAITKVKELAPKPNTGRYLAFYMGDVTPAPTTNNTEGK